MRRKLLTILVIGALAIFASAPAAWCGVEKGDKEIGGNFSLSHNSMSQTWDKAELDYDYTEMSIGVDGFFGYMLTDKLELAFDLWLDYAESTTTWTYTNDTSEDIDESSLTFIPGISIRYLFGSSRLRPFIGLGVLAYVEAWSSEDSYEGTNISKQDTDTSGWGFMVPLGLKYFVSERAALNIAYNLRYISYSRDWTYEQPLWNSEGDDTADGSMLPGLFTIGFSVFL